MRTLMVQERRRGHRPQNPWWDREVEVAWKEGRQANREHRRTVKGPDTERTRPVLLPGAVPTIFANVPAYLSKPVPRKRKPKERLCPPLDLPEKRPRLSEVLQPLPADDYLAGGRVSGCQRPLGISFRRIAERPQNRRRGWDGMRLCDGEKFSTYDRDNDKSKDNCAKSFRGGWWYRACHACNPNGLNLNGYHESYADGIEWSVQEVPRPRVLIKADRHMASDDPSILWVLWLHWRLPFERRYGGE
ncbi:hypothetical protein HPB52_019564 [Rhipicephalus sanguineus]|uniref:Fibrinogen C-terminal domain-containing protein n=1 Tax=Rhipicephalus sanguineus TaxID=34632 RepID=A0A9D4PXH9_RHISA|nr:hypothetical protein HPB52_019564 [Rhipicephalus sanguineus]